MKHSVIHSNQNRFRLFKRIKEYIVEKFLPAYAKEIYRELKLENIELRKEIEILQAYTAGLERGANRIKIINNTMGGDKK